MSSMIHNFNSNKQMCFYSEILQHLLEEPIKENDNIEANRN